MKKHKIIAVRHLTNSTFVLRLERNNMQFQTGQFVLLNIKGLIDQREYSIYSGEKEEFMEVLVREIEGGKVSGRLKLLKAGQEVGLDGAFGFFRFDPVQFPSKKFLFVATGTGISPFHSFVKTYPHLDYKLVHGVRFVEEAYDHDDFEQEKIILCTTGDKNGNFNGRVTKYLADQDIKKDTNCFLCGNSEMINEVFDILIEKGIPVSNIYTEVYF